MGIIDHQTNINRRLRIEISGSAVITASVKDNFNIIHPIPRHDHSYYWITSSLEKDNRENFAYGYATSSTDIKFVVSQVFLTSTLPPDNDPTYKFDTGTLVYGFTDDIEPFTWRTRTLLASTNGPYQNSSWKQVRVGESVGAKYIKNNSKLVIHRKPELKKNTVDGKVFFFQEKRNPQKEIYDEPFITTKMKPFSHKVSVITDQSVGLIEPQTYLYTYTNKNDFLANNKLDQVYNLKRKEAEIYSVLYRMYNERDNVLVRNFLSLIYDEVVWPKEENTFLGRTRTRTNYVFNWRNNRIDRRQFSASNAMGRKIPTSSVWHLDYVPNINQNQDLFTTASTYYKGPSVGTLNTVSPVYTNSGSAEVTASAIFSYPMPDSSSHGVYFTNGTPFRV